MMKANLLNLMLTALAAALPFTALAAEKTNCPMANDSAQCAMHGSGASDQDGCAMHKDAGAGGDGCCSMPAAAMKASAFAGAPGAPMASASRELSEADAAFLAGYQKIHAALAADDLATAKAAAATIDDGTGVAAAKNIKEARTAFKVLSEKAIAIGKGRDGLYVLHCPMAKADWLQTSKDVKNPYYGKSMLTCGYVKE